MERIGPTGKPTTTITNVSFGSQYKITMATGLIFEAHAGSRSLYYSVQTGVGFSLVPRLLCMGWSWDMYKQTRVGGREIPNKIFILDGLCGSYLS